MTETEREKFEKDWLEANNMNHEWSRNIVRALRGVDGTYKRIPELHKHYVQIFGLGSD